MTFHNAPGCAPRDSREMKVFAMCEREHGVQRGCSLRPDANIKARQGCGSARGGGGDYRHPATGGCTEAPKRFSICRISESLAGLEM